MRIAVCDDSPLDREMAISLLNMYFEKKSVRYDFTEYEDGCLLLQDVSDGEWFDIVFLDIYIPKLLGIDIARRLRDLGFDGKIVFLSNSPDFAVDSYDVEAAGYLLKPHDYEKLCTVMDRILLDFRQSTLRIVQHSKVCHIPLNEILYVESSNTKCMIHRAGGQVYTVYRRLNEIERELEDDRFLRCHQSFLVNMDYIQRADKEFELTTGDIINIRQRDLKNIRERFLKYASDKETQQLPGRTATERVRSSR